MSNPGSSSILCQNKLRVDLERSHFKVSDRFLSVTIDSNAMRNHWGPVNLSHPRLLSLAKGLSPATLRLGGTSQDYATFTWDVVPNEPPAHPWRGNFSFNRFDWDQLHGFVRRVGWDLLYGLNANHKNWSTGRWDSSNAEKLLQYTMDKNYTVKAWSLGNGEIVATG